jgi:phospholipase C
VKHLPTLLLALVVPFGVSAGTFACSSSKATTGAGASSSSSSSASGSSSGGGMGGGAFLGPAAWNRMVTPPSDSDATTQRAACGYKAGSLPAETQGSSFPSGDAIPVKHILIMMMENRSFDSYFSKLSVNGQPDVETPPAGYTNPDGKGGTIAPYHDTLYCLADTNHEWDGSHAEYDDGKMDGFFLANDNYGSPPAHPQTSSLSGARALAYYDDTDIPFYYWLANTFAIADHYHAALLGPTWPNRMYLYASSSRGTITNVPTDFTDQKGTCTTDAQCNDVAGACVSGACKGTCKTDLDCGVDAPAGTCNVSAGGLCSPVSRTIFDYMEQRHLNWKVYAQGTPGWALMLTTWLKYKSAHQFTMTDYLNDAKAGTLPDVAFVDPDLGNENYMGSDEHPPGMPQGGQNFTASVIDALAHSPAWSESALFLTYDEHGGFWDHVPPPPACEPDAFQPQILDGGAPGAFNQYGVRVPMMVVSPYAKKHYVSHQVYDHTSLVRFIQARFVLPAITGRDANALAPWDMFDFTQQPAAPPTITVPPIDATGQAACAAIWAQ